LTSTPLTFFTEDETDDTTRDAALDTGIEHEELDLIEKPLSLDGFLGKVREVLDR